ncbi:sensor histidine kinase [Anaerobranca gottschalkii]|uniref:histidine kinase n=1 Tax=Anaerobranca gottschalkii DSM 13577 TaxID=1120990 RepID=A0A1I0AJG1_9FIRM|nr:ATP-binding protein [Anaerobranca gottschalkii]SES94471.1 Sensor_kinase_SpoOB-type, alpha-helical domain [Anaerobranca gottschalkii DSM 13577]
MRELISFKSKSNLKLNYLIDGILIQSFLQILLIAFTHKGLFPDLNSPYYQGIVGIAIIVNLFVFILVLLNIKRLKTAAIQETMIAQQKKYLDNLGKLVETIQQQKHDFINHLQVIAGLTELNDVEELRKYVKEITAEVKPQFQFISLKRLELKSLLFVKAGIAKDKNIDFNIQVSDDFEDFPLCKIEGVNLLGNLINNAFTAALKDSKPKVFVHLDKEEKDGKNFYIIKVQNNGTTIPQNLGDKIFAKGYSTNNTDGLGLYIVKSIVDKYNGEISYTSSEENGTVFTIRIPT